MAGERPTPIEALVAKRASLADSLALQETRRGYIRPIADAEVEPSGDTLQDTIAKGRTRQAGRILKRLDTLTARYTEQSKAVEEEIAVTGSQLFEEEAAKLRKLRQMHRTGLITLTELDRAQKAYEQFVHDLGPSVKKEQEPVERAVIEYVDERYYGYRLAGTIAIGSGDELTRDRKNVIQNPFHIEITKHLIHQAVAHREGLVASDCLTAEEIRAGVQENRFPNVNRYGPEPTGPKTYTWSWEGKKPEKYLENLKKLLEKGRPTDSVVEIVEKDGEMALRLTASVLKRSGSTSREIRTTILPPLEKRFPSNRG